LQAGPTQRGVFLIENVEGRQTNVGDFFVAEHELVARVGAARRQVDRVTVCLGGGAAASQRQQSGSSENRYGLASPFSL
jgi:hypothetical protein